MFFFKKFIFCAVCVCDPSDPNQCKGNGKCEVESGQFVCYCKEGYTGKECGKLLKTSYQDVFILV